MPHSADNKGIKDSKGPSDTKVKHKSKQRGVNVKSKCRQNDVEVRATRRTTTPGGFARGVFHVAVSMSADQVHLKYFQILFACEILLSMALIP